MSQRGLMAETLVASLILQNAFCCCLSRKVWFDWLNQRLETRMLQMIYFGHWSIFDRRIASRIWQCLQHVNLDIRKPILYSSSSRYRPYTILL